MENLLKTIIDAGQDFEWYPTTPEIIAVVKKGIGRGDNVLDIGAGDGRVLDELTEGYKYAIEKSVPLIQAMPAGIIIVGTDFHQTTLIDKKVDVIFCNPPYSEYEQWTVKIINEAFACRIFLVIPQRWKDSPLIAEALKKREATAHPLGSFDFLNAERQARARVDVIKISLKTGYRDDPDDPFGLWFDNEFDFDRPGPEPETEKQDNSLRSKLKKSVVAGKGKVPALVELYDHEMAHLYDNFKQISALDGPLLDELGTSKRNIQEALKQRISGLKKRYWKELFDHLDDITSRLTTKSRTKMLEKLNSQTNVDFTESNIYGVLIWVIKNANRYFDGQLVDAVEDMITEANILKYKSNQKLYDWNNWRFNRRENPDYVSHFGLELRLVLERHQALARPDKWGFCSSYDFPGNLHQSAHDVINDLITIANNLGFRTFPSHNTHQAGEWESGKTKEFYDTEGEALMWVKAFKNGNLHIKFNQNFIRRLNVEFGRLKGWLQDKHQAAEELNIPVDVAGAGFGMNKQIDANKYKLLEG